MFLSLGGSRWRAAQVQQQGNAQSHGNSSPGSLLQELNLVREDPLQALASGKYAPSQTSPLLSPGCKYASPEQPVPGSLSCSPKSILSYHMPNVPSLSREVSSDSGVSLPGGEEAMSRDCTLFEPTRRSPALDLAKKLRSSLGSKFADSLRETIKEVVMKHDSNAWSPLAQQSLEETTTSGEPASHSQAWKSNGTGNHSSSLAFDGLPTLESSLKERSFATEHSKRLSWFSQENLSQSAIAELSWGRPAQGVPVSTPSSAMVSKFFTAGNHSDLSLSAILTDSGARESWTDGATVSRPRSSISRRHVFPEAAAMGTCRLDTALPQQTNCNFRARSESGSKPSFYKKANGVDDPSCFLDMSKGLGKDYESLLEILNPGQSARSRSHAKQAAAKDWHEDASTSYYGAPFLELPELGIESSKAPKRSRDNAYSGGQLSKRQCLLDVPSDDDGAGVKADPIVAGVFEEYLANLTATARVPSFQLPDSPLTNLLEDFSRDSIVPIHLP